MSVGGGGGGGGGRGGGAGGWGKKRGREEEEELPNRLRIDVNVTAIYPGQGLPTGRTCLALIGSEQPPCRAQRSLHRAVTLSRGPTMHSTALPHSLRSSYSTQGLLRR